jgi:hypothetical protein
MKIFDTNQKMKNLWKNRFIDLIAPISDSKGMVLVFTPDGKFLSPDTAHLTKEGAKYFAKILHGDLIDIIRN